MRFTLVSLIPALLSALSRLKCEVEPKGTAMFLPARSLMVLADSTLVTSDSASPMTSWIHTIFTGRLSGAETARTEGLDPARPMSIEREPKAWITSPPELNWFHWMVAFGMQASSRPRSLTIRSAFGMDCHAMRMVPVKSLLVSTGQVAVAPVGEMPAIS